MHTTWGNPAFKDFVAHSDATVVQRLEQAGAITVGKTNVALMLADFAQTANPVYGVTNNPWDITRTPGGSTGGGAAALAAGMTFLDYGTDLVEIVVRSGQKDRLMGDLAALGITRAELYPDLEGLSWDLNYKHQAVRSVRISSAPIEPIQD